MVENKVKNQLQEKNNKLGQSFFDLGVKCYEQVVNQKEVHVQGEVDEIVEILKEIYATKQEILEEQSTEKICINCQTLLTEEAKFCNQCGTKVEEPSSLVEKPCTVCNISQDVDNDFCVCCGKEFEGE